MKLVMFIILILALCFGQWVGKPFSWILTPCVQNPYGAIVITFLLILSFIRLFNLFVGETQMRNVSFPKINIKNKKDK